MWAAKGVRGGNSEALHEVADGLSIAYLRLTRAAVMNQHLAVIDTDYQIEASWDVSVAVHEAIADIEHAARVHGLAARHDFWKQSDNAAAAAAANTRETSPELPQAAAEQLMNHAGAALEVLVNLSLHTSDAKISHALRAVGTAVESMVASSAMDFEGPWAAAS